MKKQILQDDDGNSTVVFIPFKEWELIKASYPYIDEIDGGIPNWEKDIIDDRLKKAIKNPEKLLPIKTLLGALKNE